ncbi:DUF6531 domain-containing protein [Sphingomonas sanxanigenens]|uniref:LysM domain-containing protein n=1 Tax=Sphingomonas sanxanigenens DSM 19645 = NX02 TaxID=1123269 RepID=W0AJ01_9SPHN|nr:LysM peptidoglycan-binding domain-containing protein [Sphingomonas sanxanigenens]AHE55635.1 hypothetical protein NX02_19880 [Sphingomonas sanxanigenens DSM 19645 = NX02]
MVAIVTGSGLGLERGSGFVLGSRGMLGDAATGRMGENVTINAATGNLVIQRKDEILIGRGPDNVLARTYNSLGGMTDDNGDNWMMSAQRRIVVDSTANTVTRFDWDGSSSVYGWDSGANAYVSKAGAGAFDTIRQVSGVWTWTDGPTQTTETYDMTKGGNVTATRDTDGNTLTYTYNAAGQLTRVTTADSDYTELVWSGSNITQLVTYYRSDSSVPTKTAMTRTHYTYDAQNRLKTIITDLTPLDNSISDGEVVTTTYTYDDGPGANDYSRRITRISESGGATIDITYTADKTKVASYTQYLTGTITNTVSFSYASGVTTITDGLQQVTKLSFNADNQLTKIEMPPAQPGGAVRSIAYVYDAGGNVTKMTDGGGKATTYQYDTNGNLTLQRDDAGNTITRTYGAKNEVLTETRYTAADEDDATVIAPAGPVTTRYVYDGENHLVFAISAEGNVTEFIYNSFGQQTATIAYPDNGYDVSALGTGVSPTEATLLAWKAAITNLSTIERETFAFDFRGNITQSTKRASASDTGAPTGAYSRLYYSYDQFGNLLSRRSDGISNSETFTYDGLGRLASSHDLNNATTTIVHDDALNRTVTTFASGMVQTATYNRAGQLISLQESGSGHPTATAEYRYDTLGRLRTASDASGRKTYHLYDALDRKIADVSGDGGFTEYRYDAAGRLVATIGYSQRLNQTQLTALATAEGISDLSTIRPVDPLNDAGATWEWRIYDRADRLVQVIDGGGNVTSFDYDGRSNLIRTTGYYNTRAPLVASFKVTTPTVMLNVVAHAKDNISRVFYDEDGRQEGTLDGAGYLTRTIFNAAGEVVETIAYSGLIADTNLRSTGTLDELVAATSGSAARHRYFTYDGRGWLTYELDTNLRPTSYLYDGAGNLIGKIDYAKSIAASASYGNSYVAAQVAGFTTSDNATTRWSWTVFDEAGRVGFSIDAQGGVTRNSYDALGRLTKVTAFSVARTITSPQDHASMLTWVGTNYNAAVDRETRYIYDLAGRVAYEIDSEGYVTEIGYDAEDRVTLRKRYASPFAIDDNATTGDVASLIGASAARAESFSYDPVGRLSTSTDGIGTVTRYLYDAQDRITDRIVADGTGDAATLHYAYDAAGRLANETSAYGQPEASVTSYAYDGMGNMLTRTDGTGAVTTYTYDQLGRVLSVLEPGLVASAATSFVYDGFGNVIRKQGQRAEVTTYAYDALNRLIWEVDAEGYATRTTYMFSGDVESVTRYANRVTASGPGIVPTVAADATRDATISYVRDKLGRATTKTDALGYVTTTTYNAFGEIASQIAPRDTTSPTTIQTNFTYNRRGLLTQTVVDAVAAGKNLTTFYEYNGYGERRSVTDAANSTTLTRYDDAGRVSETQDALDHLTVYTYDRRGNLVATTDALGNVTRNVYDKAGNRIATVDALGGVTSYRHDAEGRLIATTAYANRIALSGTTPLQMALTLPTVSATADQTTRYAYDGKGQLRFTLDALMRLTQFGYDAAGNLVRTTSYDGAVAADTNPNVNARYDLAYLTGQVNLLASLPNTRIERSVYDALGRLTFGIDSGNRVTAFAYDAQGNRSQQVAFAALYGSGSDPTHADMATWSAANAGNAANRVSRTFHDAAGQLVYSVDAMGYVTEYRYNKMRQVEEKVAYPATYAIDDASTIATIASTIGTTLPDDARIDKFIYDSAGRLIETVDRGNVRTVMQLDALGRTTSVTVAFGTPDAVTTTRSYDALGQVESETRAAGTGRAATTGYTYDALGRLDTSSFAGIVTKWTYDALGRTETRYDAFGIVDKQLQQSFTYDAFGRLKSETDRNGKTTVREYDQLDRLKSVSVPVDDNAANNLVTRYDYSARGNVKTTDAAGGLSYSYVDKLGRNILTVDAEGYVTRTTYDAFSNVDKVTRFEARIAVTPSLDTPPVPVNSSGSDATTDFDYDKLDRVQKSTDAEGHYELYGYNAFGDREWLRNKLSDQDGMSVATFTYRYDKMGRLISETLPASHTTPDGAVLVTEIVNDYSYDRRGNRIRKVELSNVVNSQQVQTDSRTTEYKYDELDRLTESKITNQVAVLYDGLLTSPAGQNQQIFVERLTYDARGNLVRSLDASGANTDFYYDELGRRTAQLRATTITGTQYSGTLTTWTYDGNGNVKTERVHDGAVPVPEDIGSPYADPPTTYRETQFNYDYANRLKDRTVAGSGGGVLVGSWSTINPGSGAFNVSQQKQSLTTSYTYDKLGNVTKVTDPNGASVTSYYDRLGRRIAQVDQENYVTYYTLDSDGNVLREERSSHALNLTTLPASVNGLAPNRIGYSRFEGQAAGWTIGADTANIVTSGPARNSDNGKQNLKIDFNATGPEQTVSIATDWANSFSVTGGERLSVRAGVEVTGPAVWTKLVVWWVDANGLGAGSATIDGRWGSPIPYGTILSGTITVPPTAASARFEVYTTTSGAGIGSLQLTEPMVTRAPADVNRIENSGLANGPAGWVNAGQSGAITLIGQLHTGSVGATNYLRADFNATGPGQTMSLATDKWWPATGGEQFHVRTGVEGLGAVGSLTLTIWWQDAFGNGTRVDIASLNGPQAYNTVMSGTVTAPPGTISARFEVYMTSAGAGTGSFNIIQPSVSLSPLGIAALPSFVRGPQSAAVLDAPRITTFTYDRNGRRLTETRKNVVRSTVGGTGAISNAVVDATITYTYNGLGQVTSKTEANGDRTDYVYDAIGRLTQEKGAAFADYTGTSVRPTTTYAYNGRNDLTRTEVSSAGYWDVRVTKYVYDRAGRMTSMTDAANFTRSYAYDAMGRVTRESYTRQRGDGSANVYEGIGYRYDAGGRLITQAVGTRATASGDFIAGGTELAATWMRYNSFDEMTDRGIGISVTDAPVNTGGRLQEVFDYDAAGRLWRSRTDDGVTRIFLHDKNGNQTLSLISTTVSLMDVSQESAAQSIDAGLGTSNIAGAITTIELYDKRGMSTATREPARQINATSTLYNLTRSRAYNAFGEVVRETDALNRSTTFEYNALGRLTRKTSPQVEVTSANGVSGQGNPIERYAYDVSGRLIGIQDANGFWNTRLLLAGTGHGGGATGGDALVLKEFHADSGIVENKYDVFGDKRVSINEASMTTLYGYDAMSRLVQVVYALRPANEIGNTSGDLQLIDQYRYDGLGQRIATWNSMFFPTYTNPFAPPSGNNTNQTVTTYDALGRVVATRAMGGELTTYSYYWDVGMNFPSIGVLGGWVKTTTNMLSKNRIDRTNYFGWEKGYRDFGGRQYNNYYNFAGQKTSGGWDDAGAQFQYYNTGLLKHEFNDGKGSTSYTYDQVGNLKSETFTTDFGYQYRNATANYDALGRMTSWSDSGGTANGVNIPAASVTWKYDAVGNVRSTTTTYRPLNDQGDAVSGLPPRTYWYLYDSMNRVTTSQGELVNGAIGRGTEGRDIFYDKAGKRTAMIFTKISAQYIPDPDYHPSPYDPPTNEIYVSTITHSREDYQYTADGYLAAVRRGEAVYQAPYGSTVVDGGAPTTAGPVLATYTRDAMGRITAYSEGANYSQETTYNAASQITVQRTTTVRGDGTYLSIVNNDYDAVGNLTFTTTDAAKNGSDSALPDNSTTYTYEWWDGPLQKTIVYDSDTGNVGNAPWSTTFNYSTAGSIRSASIIDGRSRTVSFITDINGAIINRDENDAATNNGDPRDVRYFFGGKQMGHISNNGIDNVDYAASVTDHLATPGYGAFRNGASSGSAYSSFADNYEAINGYNSNDAATTYVVNTGDTLASIAQATWGDASLWYVIADANGLFGSETLVAGQTLKIPDKVVNAKNNASTFKVYDPNEAIGDNSPSDPVAPKQPKKKGCGTFGAILLVAVSVAVAAIAGPAIIGGVQTFLAGGAVAGSAAASAAAIGGGIIGGALTGAAASIVSQGVGIAAGIQDSFNWKNVGLAAVAGAVGGGIQGWGNAVAEGLKTGGAITTFGKVGAFLGRSGFTSGLARGVITSAISQGVSVATGLQNGFDWGGIVASGLGGGVNAIVGGTSYISGAVGGVAGAAATSLILGRSFGDTIISSLPSIVGNTIGGLVANAVEDSLIAAKASKIIKENGWDEKDATLKTVIRRLLEFGASDSELRQSLTPLGTEVGPMGLAPSSALGPHDVARTVDIPYDGGLLERIFVPANARIDEVEKSIRTKDFKSLIDKYFDVEIAENLRDNPLRPQAEKDLSDALNKLMTTNVGKRIILNMAYQDYHQKIVLSPTGGSAAIAGKGSPILYNFRQIGEINIFSSDTSVLNRNTIALAHELGHSVLGYRDPVRAINVNPPALDVFKTLSKSYQDRILKDLVPNTTGDNVRYVENPIRKELGISPRKSYLDEAIWKPYHDTFKKN